MRECVRDSAAAFAQDLVGLNFRDSTHLAMADVQQVLQANGWLPPVHENVAAANHQAALDYEPQKWHRAVALVLELHRTAFTAIANRVLATAVEAQAVYTPKYFKNNSWSSSFCQIQGICLYNIFKICDNILTTEWQYRGNLVAI